MRQTHSLPATLKAVSDFIVQLETVFDSLPNDSRVTLLLAIEELCVNIVEHGYAGTQGDIHLEWGWKNNTLDILVQDQAPNGYTPPEQIALPDLMDIPEKGIGLYIIHQVFDQVDYERLSTGNRWTLSKALGGF
ncbi:MAG: ATP-binding protein [Anaerolineae bacterium]|nr:ATP-binding protein [Anaerolineae bacterium]